MLMIPPKPEERSEASAQRSTDGSGAGRKAGAELYRGGDVCRHSRRVGKAELPDARKHGSVRGESLRARRGDERLLFLPLKRI